MSDLKTCPMCGGVANITYPFKTLDGNHNFPRCYVECAECGTKTQSSGNETIAISLWQARAAPIASAPPAQPTPMSGECFIVKGSGETDLPVVHIAYGFDAARHAVLSLMYSDPKEADPDEDEGLFADLDDAMGEGNYWSIAFEIGGISVERVCLDATPLQPIAAALPAAQPGEKS